MQSIATDHKGIIQSSTFGNLHSIQLCLHSARRLYNSSGKRSTASKNGKLVGRNVVSMIQPLHYQHKLHVLIPQRMLGHLYCAESLIMLNRLNEAKAYLDQNFISNLNSQDFETKDWQINSIDAAQSVLRYNLAVTLMLQGDYHAAKNVLSLCTHPVVFTKYKLLKMYMELAFGHLENCKIMVKFDTPQFR